MGIKVAITTGEFPYLLALSIAKHESGRNREEAGQEKKVSE